MTGEGARDLVISHYRVERALGEGGMGEVYAGVDETLQRRVALKAVKPERRLDPDAKARFLREARILSQLDDPHICRVYDYIEADGRDWLVLELIEGQTLHRTIRRGLGGDDRLRIATQIARVLVATHAAGIVHRDLKPGNVMITPPGDVKVLDFGLSASVPRERPAPPAGEVVSAAERDAPFTGDASDTRLPSPAERHAAGRRLDVSGIVSTAGAVMGTVGYMSPEQARGEPATPASDLYSFGLLLQELYSGQPPYLETATYAEALAAAQRGDIRPATGLPAGIRVLIERLTAAAPAQRPTAIATVERLHWIQDAPRRRLRRLGAAALLAVLVFGAAKYTLDLSRERTAAVQARDEAAQRRDQAEDLIGFMLGDLRPKLQQVGRLDLLEDVGQRAMAYFGAVASHTLSDEELFRRSQAMRQLGEIKQARADLPGALDTYRESLRLAADVAARDPANADWQLGLAAAHFYVGDVLRRQRDLDGAMREFSAYRDIARRLVDRDPHHDAWLLELSYAHGGVASVQEAQGDFDGARRELQFALDLKRDLAHRVPNDVERLQAVATGHNRLGVVLDRLGEPDQALQHFLSDLDIRQRLIARDPRNRAIRRSLTVAQSSLGHAYEERGDLEAARAQFAAWVTVTGEQVAIDPGNADWARDLARAETVLASVERHTGLIAEAEARFARALTVLRPLAVQAGTDAARQRDLAAAELGLGQVRLARRDAAAALRHAAAATRTLAPLLERRGDRDAARLAAEAWLLTGDAWTALGNREAAAAERERARETLAALAGPADRRTMAVLARALLALGRRDEADPLIARLESMGYRHPALRRAMAMQP